MLPGLLVLAGTIVYANSLRGAFLFDDHANIVESRLVRGPGTIGGFLRAPRPAVSASLALNYAWGGLNVTGYHVFNVAVHLTATLLLFGIVRRTLRRERVPDRYRRHAAGIAFCVALLWCAHPLQTQAVTYIVQRGEAMMACCFLFCVYSLVRGAAAARAWPWYVGAVAAFCLGLASKEVMVVAPVVMLLYDRTFLTSSWREVFRQRGWLYAVYALPLVLAFVVYAPRIVGSESVGFSLAITPWQYLRSQPGVILHYLRLAVWPSGLCLDDAWPVADTAVAIVLPGLLVTALIGASVYALWRWPGLGFLGLAFFLVLAPTSSILPINDLAMEHRMYLPLAAVIVLAVLACWELLLASRAASPTSVATCLILLAAVLLGGLTISRNGLYHDPAAMWADIVQKAPHNGRAYTNLGELLTDADRIDEALPHLWRGVAMQPRLAHAHANLARALLMQGSELSLAQRHSEVAVQLEPNSGRFRQQLGLIAAKRRDYPAAARQFREAIQLDPTDALLHINLGQCLEDLKEYDAAAASYRTAIDLDPASPEARKKLIDLLLLRNRLDEALDQSRQFVERCGNDAVAHYLLGLVYQQFNRFPEALNEYKAALRIDPHYARAHYDKGVLHQQLKDYTAAVSSYLEAVRAQPDFADAHNNLAGLFLMSNRADKAVDRYEAALRADPAYHQARYNLAIVLTQQGRLDEAVSHYRQLLKDQPGFKAAQENLDKLLRWQKRQTKAGAS